jgi:hypothetical protein
MMVLVVDRFFRCSFLMPVMKLCEIAPSQYGGGRMNIPDSLYPPRIQGAGAYIDGYGRPLVQLAVGPAGEGMIPYSSSKAVAVAVSGAAVSGGAYDPSLTQR